jgi:hypothetical protein
VDEEQRTARRVSEEELRRAVDHLKTFNEKWRQEIAARKTGEELATPTWAYEVEATQRSLTEDFEEQGIIEYVKAVNQGRHLASDVVRWLSLLFEEEFTTMLIRVAQANLLAGLTEGQIYVQKARGFSALENWQRHVAPEAAAQRKSTE